MVSKVLVPLDGSQLSEEALGLLAVVPGLPAATLLRVVEDSGGLVAATSALERTAASLQRESTILVRSEGDPSRAIVEEAARGDYGLIVMTTQGRGGLKRLVLGSVAEQVVRRSPVPVLLATPNHSQSDVRVRKVLVPLDGREAMAESVLGWVRELCLAFAAEAVLFSAVWVEHPQHAREEQRALAMVQAELEARRAQLAEHGVEASCLAQAMRDPAEVILEAAESVGADLIAMATHGREGLSRWLHGSVAETVLRSSRVPVLLLRAPGE